MNATWLYFLCGVTDLEETSRRHATDDEPEVCQFHAMEYLTVQRGKRKASSDMVIDEVADSPRACVFSPADDSC